MGWIKQTVDSGGKFAVVDIKTVAGKPVRVETPVGFTAETITITGKRYRLSERTFSGSRENYELTPVRVKSKGEKHGITGK
jgi:hypothetical protein